jgi:hypothetical protein
MELSNAREVFTEISDLLLPLPPRPYNSTQLRSTWKLRFAEAGWALTYSLENSNLTIPFLKDKVGVCVQLGNVCRVYADLLKLRALFLNGKIRFGVLVVPSQEYSQQLGSNHADSVRLERDLDVLYPAIELPLLVIAVNGFRG